jgi:hypothetical protein
VRRPSCYHAMLVQPLLSAGGAAHRHETTVFPSDSGSPMQVMGITGTAAHCVISPKSLCHLLATLSAAPPISPSYRSHIAVMGHFSRDSRSCSARWAALRKECRLGRGSGVAVGQCAPVRRQRGAEHVRDTNAPRSFSDRRMYLRYASQWRPPESSGQRSNASDMYLCLHITGRCA